MRFRRWLALAAAVPMLAAGQARAADTVVARVARPTPVTAADGRVVFSEWDGSSYRLELLSDGVVSVLPVAGSPQPFVVDLGPGPDGHELATYPRCLASPPDHPRVGCDLYQYDFTTAQERPLSEVNTSANEVAGAVWRNKLVFTRVYGNEFESPNGVYVRRTGERSHRLGRFLAISLDLRGTRISFEHQGGFGSDDWLLGTDGRRQLLARIPNSGGNIDNGHGRGPTVWGSAVYWLFTDFGDHDHYSEIHRYNRDRHRDERAAPRIPASSWGFSYDGSAAYYTIGPDGSSCPLDADCPTEVHRVDGLEFKPAPPINLP